MVTSVGAKKNIQHKPHTDACVILHNENIKMYAIVVFSEIILL